VVRSALPILLLLTLLFCSALAASAQTLPPIVQTQRVVSGNLVLNSGAPAPNSLVRIQLSYCGGNSGRVIAADGSVTMVSFQPFDVRTNSSGLWSTPLYGSDQIWCGVQQGASRWRIMPIYNGVSGDAVDYQVNSCIAYTTLNPGATCNSTTSTSFFDIDTAPLCIGGGNPGTRTYDCALHFPYVVPPPPPVQGPPGPPGPPGPGSANPGIHPRIAYYASDGSLVSDDPRFTDNSSTLAYQGDSYLSGSQTIDSILYVNGAYYMDSSPTVSAMAPAPLGRSAMGISSDGNFYISNSIVSSGAPKKICTAGDTTCGGGGSGAVAAAPAGEVTYYPGPGTLAAVSGDANLTDTGGTLSYFGNGYVQGNDTVDNILYVNGAYYMDTMPSASPMVAAPTGRSAMGVSNDGNFYISANAGAPSQICTTANGACPSAGNAAMFYPVTTAINSLIGGPPVGWGFQASIGIQNATGSSDVAPTATAPAGKKYVTPSTASTLTQIGMTEGQNGSNSNTHPLAAFNHFGIRIALQSLTNSRFYWGLATWNNTSTLNATSSAIYGTTRYATDAPTGNTIGFRFSSTTDTNFKALAVNGTTGLMTLVDTLVPADTNPHLYEILPNSSGTAMNYYIDKALVATISTNLPNPVPSNISDSMADMFWCGDNKNQSQVVSLTFYYMDISHK
jgi:hypothetical protein